MARASWLELSKKRPEGLPKRKIRAWDYLMRKLTKTYANLLYFDHLGAAVVEVTMVPKNPNSLWIGFYIWVKNPSKWSCRYFAFWVGKPVGQTDRKKLLKRIKTLSKKEIDKLRHQLGLRNPDWIKEQHKKMAKSKVDRLEQIIL